MGNLRDSGYRKNKIEYEKGHLKEIGSPQVMLKGTMFGYYLDGKSGFVTEQLLMPFGTETNPEKFTFRFRLKPEGPLGGRTWFETKGNDGVFHLRIRTSEENRMEALVEMGGSSILVPSKSSMQEGRARVVELSFNLIGNALQLQWSIDGQAEAPGTTLELPEGGFASIEKRGISWIGVGEEGNGFVGLLDEFGIRVEKTSSSVKESSTDIPIQTEGRVEKSDTAYILSPDSSLYYGPIELSSIPKEVIFSIEQLGTARVEIRLFGKGNNTPWVIVRGKEGKWEIALEGKEFALSPPASDTIRFLIYKQKQTITLTWNEVTVSFADSREEQTTFSIQIYQAADAVHSLKVYSMKIFEQN